MCFKKNNYVIFTFWSPWILHKHIFYDFWMDFIEILWYWKFVINNLKVSLQFNSKLHTYNMQIRSWFPMLVATSN
jgi:hypothetical protein